MWKYHFLVKKHCNFTIIKCFAGLIIFERLCRVLSIVHKEEGKKISICHWVSGLKSKEKGIIIKKIEKQEGKEKEVRTFIRDIIQRREVDCIEWGKFGKELTNRHEWGIGVILFCYHLERKRVRSKSEQNIKGLIRNPRDNDRVEE